jgi:SAM-dependent methyltransferase
LDRAAYAARRRRAERQEADSFILTDVTLTLAERISVANRLFGDALDLGSRRQSFPGLEPLAETWVRAPLFLPDRPSGRSVVVADEEYLPFADASFDLVVSVLGLHAVNDLPGALLQIRNLLKSDGLFVAALFGGSTLHELRRAFADGEHETLGGVSPRVAPFADVRDLGGLLQRAGFEYPVADLERVNITYREFFTLTEDLRAIGETNALANRSRAPLRRDTLSAVVASYAEKDSAPGGHLMATLEMIYLTGWSK